MTEKEMLNIIKLIYNSPGSSYIYNGYEAMKMAIKLLEKQIFKDNGENNGNRMTLLGKKNEL